MPELSYCVKCRSKTESAGKAVIKTAVNGRKMSQANCKKCQTKKTRFIKG